MTLPAGWTPPFGSGEHTAVLPPDHPLVRIHQRPGERLGWSVYRRRGCVAKHDGPYPKAEALRLSDEATAARAAL